MSRGGGEHQIAHGDYTAVLTEVGGGLRSLRHEDRDLVLGYHAGELRPRFRGCVLAPWPNRVVDGTYTFEGESYQLDLTEPARGHALHGLACWARFDLVGRGPSWVSLAHRLVPVPGYPFELELLARYLVDDRGLACSVTATNVGRGRAPYGVAFHPYLLGGSGVVDHWVLDLPASRVLHVTPERLVPTRLGNVDGGELDFRGGRAIGGTEVDHAFTGLTADASGRTRARVLGEDGLGVQCEWDATSMPWVQVHTADRRDPARTRRGLALEPMTCPPDAFNSGTDLVVLSPGDKHTAEWRVRALRGRQDGGRR